MLIQFTVSNFRSFGGEETLSMVANTRITDHATHHVPIGDTGRSVLRCAMLYGANAAGKSNLVKAIAFAQRLIIESAERRGLYFDRCRLPEFADKPSLFEFRFLINDQVFIYGFDVQVGKIVSEWLAIKKGDAELELFARDDKGETVINENCAKLIDPQSAHTFNILCGLPLRKDQLFLNRAIGLPTSAQGETLSSIIEWFASELTVLPAGSQTDRLLEKIQSDKTFKEFSAEFLRSVGTGVGDLAIDEDVRDANSWEKHLLESRGKAGFPVYYFPHERENDRDLRPDPANPTKVIVRHLRALHRTTNASFYISFGEESDGTQALLHLLASLAVPGSKSRTLVIDELDRSLHPLLSWEFVRFFSEANTESCKQLIVTTHEAHLLNQELLRRDEYWFVEKDKNQQSRLYSLNDFEIRKDLKLQKGYLQGRFGAIPMIGGMQQLEELLSCRNDEERDAATSPTT